MLTLLYIALLLLLAVAALQVVLLTRRPASPAEVHAQTTALQAAMQQLERALRDELQRNRTDAATAARLGREELAATVKGLSETVVKTLDVLMTQQRQAGENIASRVDTMAQTNAGRLEQMRATVEQHLQKLSADNARQLEQMRSTVDEKLQGTLEKRLGESFRVVVQQLEAVHKGLGEMQTLATGVGDLKRVLSNVSTRGAFGEVQLAALLEQVLTPAQYVTNYSPRNNGQRVEFAIRLPGPAGDPVYLPVDAKFPVEDYHRLLDAQQRADAAGVEEAGNALDQQIRRCAQDICDKYVAPPVTTDFAVLFLPVEGLFAEVVRRTGLPEYLQRQCRVVIAGPTTLWSILNSLQMGFRTLAIQERSSEVWKLLGAVKTEWSRYGEILDKVQRKLNEASNTVSDAATRTRAIGRHLRDVEQLPSDSAGAVLQLPPEEAAPPPLAAAAPAPER